jgi:hypothetical protein
MSRILGSKCLAAVVIAMASMLGVGVATSMSPSGATDTGPQAITGSTLSGIRPQLTGAVGTAAAAPTPDGKGFWTVTSKGQVSVEGDATFYGDASSLNLNGSIVSIAPTFDGRGYWLLGSDGGVFSYGDASFYGSTGNLHLNAAALQMVSTPDSRGYWFVAADGGIFSYGDASFHGSTGSMQLNRPVVGMAATNDGGGYWLVASDGGIFAFGDAAFFGSTGSLSLNEPVVGMASTANSQGYWLVAADGGIFAFGSAPFYGSASGTADPGSVVSIVATGDGGGYWIIGDDGNIYAYGDAATTGGAAPPAPGPALSPEYLGEVKPVDSTSFTTSDSVETVNGITYTQSVVGRTDTSGPNYQNDAYAEWNLGRNYSYLNTTIGLGDTSLPSNVEVRFQIFGDGTQLYSQDVTLGQDFPLHLDISGVLRIKLEVTELVGSNYFEAAYDVFGSAQVTP